MHRRIKSYVLRAGRVSNRQQQALDQWLSHFEVPFTTFNGDFSTIFNRNADVILEIGFGMGASLLKMAQDNPLADYVGIEVHQAGVGSLIADLHELNLNNVKVFMYDAVEVIRDKISDSSLAGVQIFFPDPWHKKRHNKRRLIQTEFVSLLTKKLRPGGFIHCATDWKDYAEHMLEVFSNEKELVNSQAHGGYSPRPLSRPLTKFENRGVNLGHGVWDLIFQKT